MPFFDTKKGVPYPAVPGRTGIVTNPSESPHASSYRFRFESINQKFIGMHQSILGTSTMFINLGTAAYAGVVYGGPVLGHT